MFDSMSGFHYFNNLGEYGVAADNELQIQLESAGTVYYAGGLVVAADAAEVPSRSTSDNAHHPHSFPIRRQNCIMSDDVGIASLTPSSSDGTYSNTSPALSPLPVSDPTANPVRRPSSGRVLVPQQSSNTPSCGSTTKVSPPQNDFGPSSLGGGPTGKNYTIPPRPKPGRKPATDEPASKRKAQNRESQRAFRARKAAKVQELTDQVESKEQKHKNELNEKLIEINQLRGDLQELEKANRNLLAERDYWKDHYNRLRDNRSPAGLPQEMQNPFNEQAPLMFGLEPFPDAQHPSSSRASIGSNHAYGTPSNLEQFICARCKPDECACIAELKYQNDMYMPMDAVPLPSRSNGVSPMTGIQLSVHAKSENPFGDRETDFTARYQPSSTRAERVATNFMTMNGMTEDHDCGWCDSNPDMCLCKDSSLRPDGEDGLAALSRITSGGSIDDVKPLPVMTGPGSCADCQTNPEQRAWCQRVAQLRGEATPPRSRRSSNKSNSLDIMEPKIDTRIDLNKACASPILDEPPVACSTTFKILEGRVSMDDRMDWRNLKPVPQSPRLQDARRDTFTMEPGMFSAMELDASSILATLQNSRRPLEPRPSDGKYASLVRIAEERRRATLSPMKEPEDHVGLNAVSAFNMEM